MARSLKNQVAILTLGRVLAYAVMFFVPLVNVRTLTVEDYGFYRQWWLLFETLTPLLILGFPRSLLFYMPRSESDSEKSIYVTQTVAFLFVASLVAWGVYIVLAQVLGQGIGLLVRTYFWRLSLFTLFMMVSQFMDTLFVAERKVVQQAFYYAITSIVQAIVIICVSWFTRNVSSLFWALAVLASIKFIFVMVYTKAVYRPSLRMISLPTIRDQLSYAVPLGMASIALVLLSQTDKFIINRFMGREAFAVYAVAAFQVPFVAIIRRSITNVTLPMMVMYHKDGHDEAVLDLWQRAVLRTAVLFLPIFVFLEVSARPFITTLFTNKYQDAVPVFMIYLFLFVRSAVESGNILQVFRRTTFIFKAFAIGFLANLVLSIVLYHEMGRLGVPLSTVLVMYVITVVNLSEAGRLLGVSLLQLFPALGLLKRITVAAIPGALLWWAYQYRPVDSVMSFGVYGAAFFVAYFLLCSWFGYITMEDIRSIIGRTDD